MGAGHLALLLLHSSVLAVSPGVCPAEPCRPPCVCPCCLQVTLKCGKKEELTHVAEPSRCAPFACTASLTAPLCRDPAPGAYCGSRAAPPAAGTCFSACLPPAACRCRLFIVCSSHLYLPAAASTLRSWRRRRPAPPPWQPRCRWVGLPLRCGFCGMRAMVPPWGGSFSHAANSHDLALSAPPAGGAAGAAAVHGGGHGGRGRAEGRAVSGSPPRRSGAGCSLMPAAAAAAHPCKPALLICHFVYWPSIKL